jgi:hypothetical protein
MSLWEWEYCHSHNNWRPLTAFQRFFSTSLLLENRWNHDNGHQYIYYSGIGSSFYVCPNHLRIWNKKHAFVQTRVWLSRHTHTSYDTCVPSKLIFSHIHQSLKICICTNTCMIVTTYTYVLWHLHTLKNSYFRTYINYTKNYIIMLHIFQIKIQKEAHTNEWCVSPQIIMHACMYLFMLICNKCIKNSKLNILS